MRICLAVLAVTACLLVSVACGGGDTRQVEPTVEPTANPTLAANATLVASRHLLSPTPTPGVPTVTATDIALSVQMTQAMATAEASHRFPEVVARVNGVAIPGSDLAVRMAMVETAPPASQPTPTVRDELDILIRSELLYQEAVARGLTCTQEEARQRSESAIQRADPRLLAETTKIWGASPEDRLNDPHVMEEVQRGCAIDKVMKAIQAEGWNTPANLLNTEKPVDDYIAAARRKADIEILLPP